jgi:hypothetical protein
VHTLVLDGISLTSEKCADIMVLRDFNVRMLSIRNVKNMNPAHFQMALQYMCRPSRAADMPRLKALYLFGKSNEQRLCSLNNQELVEEHRPDAWWGIRGKMFSETISPTWAQTLLVCQGIIAFNSVLCQSPNHFNSPVFRADAHGFNFKPPSWAVATVSVSECEGCKSAPEGMTTYDANNEIRLPLLDPIPMYSSALRAATKPADTSLSFVPRCVDCLHRRHCVACNKWWCEDCYTGPSGHAENPVCIWESSRMVGARGGGFWPRPPVVVYTDLVTGQDFSEVLGVRHECEFSVQNLQTSH